MNQPYRLGVDVWEGQPQLDFNVLKQNGVAFAFIRLNDMNGGHHRDEKFDEYWRQAGQAGMYRAPYFVYNPWKSGLDNYIWLRDNMPIDAQAVAIDIEVKYAGITPNKYATDVATFLSLVRAVYPHKVIYTGQGYLELLSYWDKGDYWWAQWPLLLFPSETQTITWGKFRTLLETLNGPANSSKCPGKITFWQCSGDRFILPGSNRPIDINVFFGDENGLATFFGNPAPAPIPEPTEGEEMTKDDLREVLRPLIDEILAAIKARPGNDDIPPQTGTPSRVVTMKGTTNKLVATYDLPDINGTKCTFFQPNNQPQESVPPASHKGMPKESDLLEREIHARNLFKDWAFLPRQALKKANGNLYAFPDQGMGGQDLSKYPGMWVPRSALLTSTPDAWIESIIADLKKQWGAA